MPRLDGFGLLRELRSDPQTATIPVIMLSARAGEEARVEGIESGADDYLVKPFGARELQARVSAHIELARARRAAAAADERAGARPGEHHRRLLRARFRMAVHLHERRGRAHQRRQPRRAARQEPLGRLSRDARVRSSKSNTDVPWPNRSASNSRTTTSRTRSGSASAPTRLEAGDCRSTSAISPSGSRPRRRRGPGRAAPEARRPRLAAASATDVASLLAVITAEARVLIGANQAVTSLADAEGTRTVMNAVSTRAAPSSMPTRASRARDDGRLRRPQEQLPPAPADAGPARGVPRVELAHPARRPAGSCQRLARSGPPRQERPERRPHPARGQDRRRVHGRRRGASSCSSRRWPPGAIENGTALRRAARERPPQGRVPGDARPRAAKPARRRRQRHHRPQDVRRRRRISTSPRTSSNARCGSSSA